jgi:hypothetical protein
VRLGALRGFTSARYSGGPAVVGFPRGGALNFSDPDDLLGQFVTSDVLLCLGAEFLIGCAVALANSDYGNYLIAPALTGSARNNAVVDRWVGLQCSFHFFGKDLFSTRIDGDRITSVKFYDIVGAKSGPVTGNCITLSIHNGIGRGGLCRIVEISES